LYTLVPGDSIPTQLTWGDYDDSDPAWSPDGKHIAFVSNRTEPDANSNTDIWVVDANNPNKDKKLTQVTKTRIVTILLLGVQMENILPM
jgi:Tol biopolymer transport system component